MLYRPSRPRTVVIMAAASLVLAGCGEEGPLLADGAKEPAKLEMTGPEVIQDPDGTGIEVSQRLYEASDVVVVADPSREDQMRAAALALELGAPMLVRHPGHEEAVDGEISRLGADRVIEVPGDTDTDDAAAIEAAEPVATDTLSDVAAIAAQEAAKPIDLILPPMLATDETSRAAAATARAAGAEIEVLAAADPRATSESMRTVSEQDTLALGRQFGSDEDYAARVALAGNGELPGGGGLVFPGRRMIALYGHPYGPELGVMGEQGPAEAAALAAEYASWYAPLDEQPVIPAFEVIASVASEFPGEDGNYSNETPAEDLVPYIDAILDAGGYAVIDLQPGQGNFLEQAKIYEELLKRPNVGLALDAEWKLNPGERPLSRIGSATAAEINEVADWLAQLVRDNNLPQKMLILHQFQLAMYPDRENIVTGQPELAWVLHADGHGVPGQKFETWDALRQDLDPAYFMAWKNFIDEDTPTFTPEDTYGTVDPRPWFVSYQ
ncbi:cell wall-binding repeat-containing protein [Corynebacterium sp. TA-R-1]|uniref:Cell wall-binding repeat-containing protein n=1 Tax=Corynebacterium stercoris TaxID=2943490 RepID=A0ABT1G2Q3_9CORY|nr:cell wall-binding repeat-containing protein [Corynebacterium stercoris]MCP1387258.1 cell wall-binding repeat-containing protein [Corynebacterium stercoris]